MPSIGADFLITHRLQSIYDKTRGKVQVVLHGTNEFKLVLENYNDYIAHNTGKLPLTQLIEEGTAEIQKLMESWMDNIKSSGKA
jgi:fructose-bisphosphate aldolase class II